MPIPRMLVTVVVVPITLAAGLFACGGKIAEDEPRDAGATPSGGSTSTSTATGGGSGSGTSTSPTPTADPTPSGTSTSPAVSPTAITVSTADCPAHTNACSGFGGGPVSEIVARWVAAIVDDCEHPKTGIPSTFPSCGTIDLKFARTSDGGGCAQSATFATPQSLSFAACVATALANQKCAPGLFLPGDEGTFELCPK